MQLIAMLTMLIDHIGLIFFPQDMVWRYIGRIAFPIYCYGVLQGHLHTSSKPKYLLRLLLIALLSQIPYNLAIDAEGLNVVFTLLLSALLLVILDKLPKMWFGIPIVVLFAVLMDYFPVDYGAYGLFLVLIFRYAKTYWLVIAHFALNLFYMFYSHWVVQMFSLLPTMFIAFSPVLWNKLEYIRVPRWVWRLFYPMHLLVLALVKMYYFDLNPFTGLLQIFPLLR
ncbi:TraX family protein [Paenibacillus sp. sgz500958]|uniref:TraX family protein n=1 Tax=Paenibacillus sp. sgz500958 TaxID=3242475 RepID=UPI0036D20FE9